MEQDGATQHRDAFDFQAGEVLLIDKPYGWTSFDVVKKVRNLVKVKKVGHAGTLDPLATGLLILCTGRKTKTIDQIQAGQKTYRAEFVLGAITPTYDAEMEPEPVANPGGITPETIEEAMRAFEGSIEQTPPAYSAKKIKGVRAYKQARAGQEVAVTPKMVQVDQFRLLDYDTEKAEGSARIICGKGTYVRSLIHDLGQELGVGAYLKNLRREQIGPYRIEDAWTIDALKQTLKAENA
jgi:tRNA pseudouridine55 synthase